MLCDFIPFPALTCWNEKLNLVSQNKQGARKGKHLRNQRRQFCHQRIPPNKGSLIIIYAIENVFRVCIAWYKHERGWENSRQLCKPETKSRNSPNALSVYIRLCKHRGKVFYCFYKITFPRKDAKLFIW